MKPKKKALNSSHRTNNRRLRRTRKTLQEIKQMAQKMGNMMASMQAQSQEEDLDALQQIIENLLTLSFNQEELIDDLKNTKRNDPHYTDIARSQQKLQQDSKIIEDSLYALKSRPD